MSDLDTTSVPDYRQLIRLDDKVFVVFGAGAGMGRQTSHALSQMGAKVVCVGRSEAATQKVAEEVGGLALLGDMGKREDAEAVFKQIEATYGRLDGVVDIIGLNMPTKFMDLRESDWNAQFEQGFMPAVHALQFGQPLIAKSGGGSITIVGSMAGMLTTQGAVHYGASKAALHHMVRLMGVEFAPSNVRVNCVIPSLTVTPKLQRVVSEEMFAKLAQNIPLKRIAKASDIAAAILYLASDLAYNVTSHLLVVDGGASAVAA